MTDCTETHRAKMAEHVGELAGVALRRGDTTKGCSLLEYARDLLTEDGPEDFYLEALLEADVARDDADAAVAAVLRGERPSGSLVACVERMRVATAGAQVGAWNTDGDVDRGRESMARDVLNLLGCAPAKGGR